MTTAIVDDSAARDEQARFREYDLDLLRFAPGV
jgi:hypothetical protein